MCRLHGSKDMSLHQGGLHKYVRKMFEFFGPPPLERISHNLSVLLYEKLVISLIPSPPQHLRIKCKSPQDI